MPAAIPIALAIGTAGGGAAAGYFGMKGSNRAAATQSAASDRAAALQATAASRAADVAAASTADTLKFEQQKETTRKQELDDLNARNLVKFNEDLARRQPYMDMGVGALAQMGRPMVPQAGAAPGAPYKPLYSQTPPPPGTLGDLITKQRGT
jgi:hypothetical protein